MKVIKTATLITSLFVFSSSFAAELHPTNLVSGRTTTIRIYDLEKDITSQYKFSSDEVSIIPLSGKTGAMGREQGFKTITATHKTDPSKSQTFNVNVSPGSPSKIISFSGDLQTEVILNALPSPLQAKVVDNFNNGVKDITVDFKSSSPSAVILPSQVVTDVNGIASVDYIVGSNVGNEAIIATSSVTLPRGTSTGFTVTGISRAFIDAAELNIEVDSSEVEMGKPFSATVSVKDGRGQVYKETQKNVRIQAFKNSSCTVVADRYLANSSYRPTSEGESIFTGISYPVDSYIYIKATSDDINIKPACSAVVNVKAPALEVPASFSFVQLPTSNGKDVMFNPQVKIALLKHDGVFFNQQVPVYIEAFKNSSCTVPTDVSLNGDKIGYSSFGITTFPKLSFPEEGTIYLKANVAEVFSHCSPAIQITKDIQKEPEVLKFTRFSNTGTANQKLLGSPSVNIINQYGSIISTATNEVTLSAFSDEECTTPAPGTLFSNPAVSKAVAGTAAFSNVTYSQSGTIYIKASSGNMSTCSQAVAFSGSPTGVPASLKLVKSPTGILEVNQNIETPIEVEVRDGSNDRTSFGSLKIEVETYIEPTCTVPSGERPEVTVQTESGKASLNLDRFINEGFFYFRAKSGFLVSECSPLLRINPICPAGEHIEGYACFPDARSCSVPVGVGEQYYVNGEWQPCVAVSCPTDGYAVQNGVCECTNPDRCYISAQEINTDIETLNSKLTKVAQPASIQPIHPHEEIDAVSLNSIFERFNEYDPTFSSIQYSEGQKLMKEEWKSNVNEAARVLDHYFNSCNELASFEESTTGEESCNFPNKVVNNFIFLNRYFPFYSETAVSFGLDQSKVLSISDLNNLFGSFNNKTNKPNPVGTLSLTGPITATELNTNFDNLRNNIRNKLEVQMPPTSPYSTVALSDFNNTETNKGKSLVVKIQNPGYKQVRVVSQNTGVTCVNNEYCKTSYSGHNTSSVNIATIDLTNLAGDVSRKSVNLIVSSEEQVAPHRTGDYGCADAPVFSYPHYNIWTCDSGGGGCARFCHHWNYGGGCLNGDPAGVFNNWYNTQQKYQYLRYAIVTGDLRKGCKGNFVYAIAVYYNRQQYYLGLQ